jgi:hypothetical protein
MPTTTDEIHVGDVGTALVVEIVEWDEDTQAYVAVNISAATTLTIYLTRPNGTVLTKTAVLDTSGTDGKMKYTTVSGDLSAAGRWKIQGYVAGVAGWSGSSLEVPFKVKTSRHG